MNTSVYEINEEITYFAENEAKLTHIVSIVISPNLLLPFYFVSILTGQKRER